LNTRISRPDHPNGVNRQENVMGRSRRTGKSQGTLAQIATADALLEIAGLLAIAYRRYQTVQRTGDNQSEDSGGSELANSVVKSGHGVVS